MGMDGPISVGVMGRMPNAIVNTAAFNILLGLAIWIESPVIDLLATATTLGKSREALAVLRRFVTMVNLWVTAVHAAIVLTPAYGWVALRLLHVEPAVAEAARPGLALMIPWSALIGYRRSHQGLLIRNGLTRVISLGTLLRVFVLLAVDLILPIVTRLPGLTIVAAGLVLSVASESVFVHFVSRGVVREIERESGSGLTLRRLAAFHFPLTATTMFKLLTGPVVAAGLARSSAGTESLAAYQIAGTLVFLFRAIAFCLPEVVIALYKDEDSRIALRRFALTIGLVSSGAMLLLCLTGLDGFVFRRLLDAPENLASAAHWMLLACSALPALDAGMSFVLGTLTAHHLTMSRMYAVFFSGAVLVGSVALGTAQSWPAPMLAAGSIALSLIAELAVLSFFWVRARRTVLQTVFNR